MTPLLKEPEQQDERNSLSNHGRLSLLTDFSVTLTDFWGQTVSPAARMLSQTVSILWKQALIPALQNWLISTRDRLTWSTKKRPKAPTMQLQNSSELAVLKIHGALGERWSADKEEQPIRVGINKQNPWVAAEKKTYTIQPAEKKPTKAGKTALSTSLDEIRGLDDIFIEPVQGSFVDVLKKPGRSEKPQRTSVKEVAKAPAAEEKAATQSVPQNVQVLQDLQAEAEMAAFQESARMQALARTQEALREESRHLGSRVKSIAESTKDWFTKTDFASEEVLLQPPPLSSAISFTSYVDEEAVVAPEANTIEKPVPKPQSLMSRPASRPAKAKPPELTYELAEDLSGFDYMIQNNRILSNSISNLVDGYFTQAALEEEPNYY